jgi:hypothetical protein
MAMAQARIDTFEAISGSDRSGLDSDDCVATKFGHIELGCATDPSQSCEQNLLDIEDRYQSQSTLHHQVSQLFQDLNLGVPSNVNEQDDYHDQQIIHVSFQQDGSDRHYLVRSPHMTWNCYDPNQLYVQVMIQQYFAANGILPAGRILGYDTTVRTALGRRFICQECQPGVSL